MKIMEELINRYKFAEYEDVISFYNSFETPHYLPFEGMGSFWLSGVNNDFLVIDKDVILFKQDKNNYLQGIWRLDINILSSDSFRDAIQADCVFYRDFELELMAELKMYEHAEETELIIAPSKKIDQIKRISLYLADNGVKYKGQDFASLDEVLKRERIAQLMEARFNKFIQDKKDKKKQSSEGKDEE